MKNIIFLLFCTATLMMVSGCVMEEDIIILENRLAALERDNQRHRSKEKELYNKIDQGSQQRDLLAKNTKIHKENYAGLKAEINGLRAQMATLTGRIEESEYRLSRFGENAFIEEKKEIQRLDNALSKNYLRLVRLENYMGFEPSDLLNNTAEGQEEESVVTEKGLYDSAKQLLDQGEHDDARALFEDFLKRFPESDNADNATFWIADSFYRDKWFEKAILEYQKVIEKYPKGNKVSAALLKQGYAFGNLGEKANARLILKELIKKHPGSHEARIAKEKLKSLK